MHLLLRTHVAAAPAQVWAGFTRELFLDLAPPFPPFHLLRFDGCHRGDEVHLELGAGPLRQLWTSLIIDHGIRPDGTYFFVDEGNAIGVGVDREGRKERDPVDLRSSSTARGQRIHGHHAIAIGGDQLEAAVQVDVRHAEAHRSLQRETGP